MSDEIPFSADAVDLAALARLRSLCAERQFLPTFDHGLVLQIAMVRPDDEAALAAIRRATHQEVRPFRISGADFAETIAALLPPAVHEPPPAAPLPRFAPPPPPPAWPDPQRPARELALALIAYAASAQASDLLLDEQEGWLDVAIKRSGWKEILPPIERDRAAAVIRAFKELAGLSTQTTLAFQTGAARVRLAPDRAADLRIEITPSVHGESLVARLQDRAAQLARMRTLPFPDPAQRAEVLACLRRAQGLIIATGPTGQGKTTTLYSCLGQLDRSRLNIRTLEDPVEFPIPWMTQIPVGAGTGRDFATGLKSLLRQAPHVILLGELRDPAAARTCLEAVETGHLLLATLHTRDAIGVVARLLDLGITGRQIASGLHLAIGQRLVRRLCPACRVPIPPPPEALRRYAHHGLPAPERLHRSAGCAACGHRGEIGVLPVFELFRPAIRPDVEDLVATAEPATYRERDVRRCWREAGGEPLALAALRLAAAGEADYAEAAALDSAHLL